MKGLVSFGILCDSVSQFAALSALSVVAQLYCAPLLFLNGVVQGARLFEAELTFSFLVDIGMSSSIMQILSL
jgi:hypothetical protein